MSYWNQLGGISKEIHRHTWELPSFFFSTKVVGKPRYCGSRTKACKAWMQSSVMNIPIFKAKNF